MAQKSHMEVYKKYSKKLVTCLPMNDDLFITELSTFGLLPGDTEGQLRGLATPAAKASYLLNYVIKPALCIDDTSSFDNLLLVMEQCGYDHVKNLAGKIKSKIDKKDIKPDGTDNTKPGESSMSTDHHMKKQRKRGKGSHKIRSKVGLEEVESEHSDRDEDPVLPQPKKRREASKQKPISETSTSKECNLIKCREIFSGDDVVRSFIYMLNRLEELWNKVEFTNLIDVCIRDKRLSNELNNELVSLQDDGNSKKPSNEKPLLRKMFNVLSNSPFLNWLEIRMLKSMEAVANIHEATEMIDIFEECVYKRKCSDVSSIYFEERYFNLNPDHLTRVKTKLNKHLNRLYVFELIKYCRSLDSIVKLRNNSFTLMGGKTGCLEVSFVIPKYCHLHTYEVVKSCFFRLRPFNIQYFQIGVSPKVFATNLTNTAKAKALLSELASNHDWSHPLQVINHYYTYLEGHMDADSVSHMMHSEHLITDSDYEAITAAPNDINMNRLLLQYVRAMDMASLLKLCDLLKNIEVQRYIGINLEKSLKLAKDNGTASTQRQHTHIAKLTTSQFNTVFLEAIDDLVAQLHVVDVEILADKCYTLMASDVHNIKLFTDSFMKKLFQCSDPNLLKLYLLPFNTWLDYTILKELLKGYENIDVSKFLFITDDTQPITSYPIPSFSQLIIPLDDSEYTIVAIKTVKNCRELTLEDITGIDGIKEFLRSYWELTAHALQLIAIDYFYNFIYWMIPKSVKFLIEDKLNQRQSKLNQRQYELSQGQCILWSRGIVQAVLLPDNFFSAESSDQQMFNDPFNISSHLVMDSVKLEEADEAIALKDDNVAMLKYALELSDDCLAKLEELEGIKKSISKMEGSATTEMEDLISTKGFDNSKMIHKDTLCKRLEEEKDDLISKISILERNYKSLQEKHQKLVDKYTQLRSQMSSNATTVESTVKETRESTVKKMRLLGSGKHGKTYSMLYNDKWCSVKFLNRKLLKPNQPAEQLNEKCTICLGLDYCNLVRFIEITQIGSEIAIINEMMQMNLSTFIKQKGADFSLFDQLSLCSDVSKGLHELHDHSILHKNLHDNNVLVQGNRAKISDFYYSLLELPEDDKEFVIPYVAPEIIKGIQSVFSVNSDVYSLGVLLLQVVTGSTERALLQQMVSTVNKHETKADFKQNFPIKLHQILYGLVDHIYECLSLDIKRRPSAAEISGHIQDAPQYVSFKALHQKNLPLFKSLEAGKQLKWKECHPLPSRMWGATAVVLGNRIYVSGGDSPDEFVGRYVFTYHLLKDNWERLPELKGHRHGIPVIAGGDLYIIGGKDVDSGKKYSDRVSKYDENEKQWKPCTNMNMQRFQPLALSHNDCIIVAGGKHSVLWSIFDRLHDDIEVLYIKYPDCEMKWKIVPTRLPVGMWAPSATISGDCIWIAGFNSNHSISLNWKHQRSDEVFWIRIADITSKSKSEWVDLPRLVPYYSATVVPNSSPLVLMGGDTQDAKVISNAIVKYNSSDHHWDEIASLDGTSRAYAAVACIGDQQAIIVMGGCSETTNENMRNISCLNLVQIGYIA